MWSLPPRRRLCERSAAAWFLATLVAVACACGEDPAGVSDAVGDAGDSDQVSSLDTGVPNDTARASDTARSDMPADMGRGDGDAGQDVAWLPAADYCELTADVFCPYYLRCGRMAAADDLDTCRAVFLEACNAVYEPRYAALEATGALRLSAAGVASCAEHLAEVPCERQIFDLDGGCRAVWQGATPAGGPCGPGIESFVCDASSTCVLALDFCGTCQPASAVGEPCGDGVSCVPEARCESGACVARAGVGEACDDARPCRLGASCLDGACAGPAIVGVGDTCDLRRRCPYRSACVGGTCVVQPLLGEACGAALPCASGFCDAGRCVALKAPGAECGAAFECVAGVCQGGVCGGLPGACFE